MPLLLGDVIKGDWTALDEALAAIQTWAGKVEGVNAALESATGGLYAVPTGAVFAWTTATAPTGWLLCDGAAVSRTDYAALFAVLGVTYGAGNGVSTFNVPDGRGRFVLGVAASGTGSTLAGTGGAIDHTHTGPSHTHAISSGGAHTHTVASHDHGNENLRNGSTATSTFASITVASGVGASVVPGGSAAFTVAPGSGGDISTDAASPATDSQGAHDHGAVTGAGGTGATSTSNPPFVALHYIIRT